MIIILCAAPVLDNVLPEPEAMPNLTTLDHDADHEPSEVETDAESRELESEI